MAEDDNRVQPQAAAATGGQPATPPSGAAAGSEPVFTALDRRVVRLWRIQNLIAAGSILAAAALAAGLLWKLPRAPRFIAPAAVLAALASAALAVRWLPWRIFSAYSYRMDDISLELRSGILWRKSVLIPISRVQHLDIQRGPLERRLGLATLQVHTAGTRHAAHVIPGLDADVALSLRERLAASANLVAR